jgi:hypothetical protein
MNSVWLSLLWKEWCEFRWKLAALTASFVICQLILIALFGDAERDVAAGVVLSMMFCLIVYAVLAGSFVGMSVSAGENSNRTMRFTQALPIPMWQTAIVRVLVGLFTVVVPIVVVVAIIALLTLHVWQDPKTFDVVAANYLRNGLNVWGINNFFVGRAVAAIVGVTSLLLWVSASGVNRSDEVRAGAIGFLVCAVLWTIWFYIMEENVLYLRNVFEMSTVVLPGGPASGGNFHYGGYTANIPLLATIAIVSHGFVLTWFATRYGKSTGRVHSGGKQFITDWFRFRGPAKPFRSQGLAIIWKQVREMGPMALLAVGGIMIFMAFAYFSEDRTRWTNHDWSELLAGLTLVVGGFVTLVSGIGMIYEDYSRGLPNFWRSRPINLHQWFFLKYFSGILVLVVAFVPLFLIAGKLTDWNMVKREEVAVFALVFLGFYSGSLAAYALVQQPIYSVVLTIATPFLGWMILVFLYPHGPPRWLDSVSGLLLLFLVPSILSTILAWQAVVRDWGWKRHR